jgi:RNA polymerase sigma factor (sigma-70 family)
MGFLTVLAALRSQTEEGAFDDAVRGLSRELERLRPKLRGMAAGELADEDAILNAACHSILRNAVGFLGASEGEAFAYCWRAVRAKALDTHRRNGRRWFYRARNRWRAEEDERPLEIPGRFEGTWEPVQEDDAGGLEERRRMLRDALARLSAAERDLVVQIAVRGEKIRDLALGLGVKENTLTRRWLRALAKLRRILLDADGHGGGLPVASSRGTGAGSLNVGRTAGL